MSAALRKGDFIARLGGDEFALLLADVRDSSVVDLICDRIVAGMAQPMTIEGTCLLIGASAGVSMFPEHGRTQENLFKRADLALYEAKHAGRGVWRWSREPGGGGTEIAVQPSSLHLPSARTLPAC